MSTQYRCENETRRLALLDARGPGGQPVRNGIDYLEVSDDQLTLTVHFLHDLSTVPGAATLSAANVRIEGGTRITDVRVLAAVPAADTLTVTVNTPGDYSTYRLRLVTSTQSSEPPVGFDAQLAVVAFSFKVNCPSEFDCATEEVCPSEPLEQPAIDYLARDYASFRRLMLDRLAVTLPAWSERNAADQMIAVVETLAYAADYLSYYQDAVATEAYLGTARKRSSIRRHTRLLDYVLHDGCNARAWIFCEVDTGGDGLELAGPDPVANTAGTLLLTKTSLARGAMSAVDRSRVSVERPLFFETMHTITLRQAHNEIRLYTWGDEQCCLPRGANRATLPNPNNVLQHLRAGDLLLFEEVRGPASGAPADADPAHRHVVRLTRVEATSDPLYTEDTTNPGGPPLLQGSIREPGGAPVTGPPLELLAVEWAVADGLPFPLCLANIETPSEDDIPGGKQPVSVARGNIVLADHGRTYREDDGDSNRLLDEVNAAHRYRLGLLDAPLTWQSYTRASDGHTVLFDGEAPASAALERDIRTTLPAITLRQGHTVGVVWEPRRDLLTSGRFARHFVVETEEDERVALRFGDGIHGQRPTGAFYATYRLGNGAVGNVGAGAIAHVVDVAGVTDVRNPLPACGGSDPEAIEEARLYAPQAFRRQERAVTEADYANVAQRHPEVARAMATRRWTGSWHTMFLTIDRRQGLPVDAEFETDLRRFLERFRLAGHDLEIDGPRFVALDIVLSVCIEPGYFRAAVKEALLDRFAARDLPDGTRGFFHPDNFTFGQPVYLSQIVAAVMGIPGVQWVDTDDTPPKPNRFRRWGQPSQRERAVGKIDFGRLEIARLDNDPSLPENGKLEFMLQGGV